MKTVAAALLAATTVAFAKPAVAVSTGNWGLDRIDRAEGLDGRSSTDATGKGVHIYILDGGVNDRRGASEVGATSRRGRTVFPEFADRSGASRVVEREDFSNSGSPDDDDVKHKGHGTRVASLAAGKTHGVARDAVVHSFKVSESDPSRQGPTIVAAINAIVASVAPDDARPVMPTPTRIINVSFGPLQALTKGMREAIQKAIDAGFVFTVSAGCRHHTAAPQVFGSLADPAFQSQGLLIVAGTDRQDRAFRDYGAGVTLYAPATQTTSLNKAGESSVPPLYTDDPPDYCADSWAAPHAAGVAATYLERHPSASPREVYAALVKAAVPGVVTYNGAFVIGPSNRLLQTIPR